MPLFSPLLQYNISSTFSHQLTRITHLLHTYHSSHYYSTTSHPHSVINLHAYHSSVTYLPLFSPLLQYNISLIFSHQLTRITHLLHTYIFSHYYSTISHPHSVINIHAYHSSVIYLPFFPLLQYNISSTFSHQLTRISLICYILTILPIITVQHLIHIQLSTHTHHSSVTYLPFFPLLQYNISTTFSH